MSLSPRAAASLDGNVPPAIAAALAAADRLIEGLVDADPSAVARELALDVCAWWHDGTRLRSVHGPIAVARAFVALLAERRPDQLLARATPEGSVLVSALSADRIAWSLELRAEGEHFTGCIVRGARPPDRH